MLEETIPYQWSPCLRILAGDTYSCLWMGDVSNVFRSEDPRQPFFILFFIFLGPLMYFLFLIVYFRLPIKWLVRTNGKIYEDFSHLKWRCLFDIVFNFFLDLVPI